MNTSLRQIEKMNWVAGVIAAVVVLVMSAGMASAKKVKAYLPDYVLKAQTVLVVICARGDIDRCGRADR